VEGVQNFDFLAADIFSQGFDPSLLARATIRATVDEVKIATEIADNTISTFTGTINLTSRNDELQGAPGVNTNTSFVAQQGSTLGGTDTINGVAGIDELTVSNLSNSLGIVTFGTDGQFLVGFSTKSGDITSKIIATNIDQFFVAQKGGSSQRLGVGAGGEDDESEGVGAVISSTSGDDTLNVFGTDDSRAKITFGSLTLDTGLSTFFGTIIFGGSGNDTITTAGRFGDLVFGGNGNDIVFSKDGADIIQTGDGNDIIIVASPSNLTGLEDSDDSDSISGGNNNTLTDSVGKLISGEFGDTIQIGDASTKEGQTFLFASPNSSVTIAGIETLIFLHQIQLLWHLMNYSLILQELKEKIAE
jgi:hypothetical protein